MAHNGQASIDYHDAYGVKAVGAFGVAVLLQPELGNLPELSLLGGGDVTFGIIVPVAGQRLYFYEDDGITVAGDDIQLTQWTCVIASENGVTCGAQELLRGLFPQGPELFGVAGHGLVKAIS